MIKRALNDLDGTPMTVDTESTRMLPRPSTYRREIAAALVLKICLLTALWFLIFRSDGNVRRSPPDIAERLSLPPLRAAAARGSAKVDSPSLQPVIQKAAHVR